MHKKRWAAFVLAAALVLLVIAAAAQIASFEVSVRFYEMKRK